MAGLTLQQLQQMGAKPAQQTGGLTLQQLQAQGAKPVQTQTPQPEQHGFLRSLIEDPIKTLLVTPAARTAEAVGRTGILGNTIKTGYEQMSDESQSQNFGGITVDAQKAFGEGGGRQILGEAAKTASYLYGGGEATGAVQAGLKGKIISGALTGAKAGAAGGGLYSFGNAIEDANNSASDVAYQTLFGTVVGGVTGGILGAATPVVVKGLNTVKSYTDINKLEEKLYNQNKEVFRPTSTQLGDWTEKKVDPIKTFTKEFGPEAIHTSGDKLHLDDFIAQTDARYKAGSEGFNTILRNSPETVSLKSTYQKAVSDINNSGLTPSAKQNALAKLSQEFQSIHVEAVRGGHLLGEDNVPAWYADNLKDRFWGATKNFGTEESTVANAVNKSLGFGFKEGIESAVTDVNVKAYNKQLQELIYLKDFLESRNGKPPGTGAKMARYTARIIGGTAGFGGGPVGSVAGSITADKVAQALINPEARTWLIRKQLAKLSPEARKSLQVEAQQIIAGMAQKRAETLRLPGPSYIPMGANIVPDVSGVVPGSSVNPLLDMQARINTPNLPAPTTIPLGPKTPSPTSVTSIPAQKGLVGVDPKSGRFKKTYKSN